MQGENVQGGGGGGGEGLKGDHDDNASNQPLQYPFYTFIGFLLYQNFPFLVYTYTKLPLEKHVRIDSCKWNGNLDTEGRSRVWYVFQAG